MSSDKQKRGYCDILIAQWPLFYHSLLFIEEWGTTKVHRMWLKINHCTYFTFLFEFYRNKKEPLYSCLCGCYSKTFYLKRRLTFWKKSIFLEEFKLRSLIEKCVKDKLFAFYPSFKSLFKSMYICTSFSTDTFLIFSVWWQNVSCLDMTVLVDWV